MGVPGNTWVSSWFSSWDSMDFPLRVLCGERSVELNPAKAHLLRFPGDNIFEQLGRFRGFLVDIGSVFQNFGVLLEPVFGPDGVFRYIHPPRVGVALTGFHGLFLIDRLACLGQKPIEKNLRGIGMGRRRDQNDYALARSDIIAFL